ncbi:anoctamin-8 isoform X2 [Strongylocentrotus purpuratus]|uniref:Anoctamin n=1 Tax=Strongylocentrotus purpuratus TaxID=7668 RepID=A0A7M7N9N4_STRPU|nr:anoctamin-8 isoform X2 [Strongylocentrotus purpuratus]
MLKAQAKDAMQHAKSFGENFARTNKYMHANKLWLQTVPTTDCEVVVIFPTKTDDAVIMWVLAKLKERLQELKVAVRHHAHTGTCGLYLSASSDCLLQGAENLSFRKPLKAEYGGGLKEFTCLEASMYEGADDAHQFLSSQERQKIIHYMLESLRAVEGDRLGKVKFVDNEPIVPKLQAKGVISKVFPLHKRDDLQVLKKTWVQAFFKPQPLDAVCDYFGVKIAIYFAWLGFYTQALLFPAVVGLLVTIFVDDSNQLNQDRSVVFVSFCNITWASLILEVWKRRGSALAYRWGTLDSKHELIEEPRPQFKGDLVVNSVSGKLQPYYPAWKRNVFRYFVTLPVILLCCIIAFVSMYLILELQEWVNSHIQQNNCYWWVGYIPKITLTVVISVSDIAFKRVAYWLNRKENYRLQSTHENQLILKLVTVQFINHFLALFYIAFILKDMTRLRNYLGTIFILRQLTGNFKESVLPYITEKLKVYRMTYVTASKFHTDEETRRQQDKSEATEKQGDMSEVTKRPENMSDRTMRQENMSDETKRQGDILEGTEGQGDILAGTEGQGDILEGTERQVDVSEETKGQADVSEGTKGQGDVSEIACGSSEEKFIITQAELESEMRSYEDTFDDYLEMVIQFGYVILFSSAFPLAGLFAVINNTVEIRSDAFKLCSIKHRPFGQRVENIGSWQQALEVMAVIGVIVNCALLGIFGHVGQAFPSLTPTGVILCIVVVEHVILAAKQAISLGIPDVPHWVSIEMAKLEYRRREALKKMEVDALHCAKKSPSVKQEDDKKGDPKLKIPQRGKVWPSSMKETAANFNLFQNDKAVGTDQVTSDGQVRNDVQELPEKPSHEKKSD